MNKWFYVMDMHSGGGRKTPFEMYFVEAPDEHAAKQRFMGETGEDPDDIACDCCGSNFSINGPFDTLAEAAAIVSASGGVNKYLLEPRNRVKVFWAETLPLTDENILV